MPARHWETRVWLLTRVADIEKRGVALHTTTEERKKKSQERSGRAGKAKKAVQKATKSQRASRYAIAREAQYDARPAWEEVGRTKTR